MVRLDPQYRLVFGAGGELLATPDADRMEAEVSRLSPSDRGAFTRFMTANRDKFARFAPFLEQPFESWVDLVTPDLLKLMPILKPWKSLDAELGSFFSDERIRLAFTFQSKYLGMSPFRCPSLFSILSFLEYEHGVFHPIGGCGAVSATMARIATEMGVEIHYGEPVESLEFNGRRVTAVRTSRATYGADATVVNADFARTMTRLVPDRLRRRWSDRKIASKRFSCSTFMLYLGIEGRYDEIPHHTIYLSQNYRENLADIETRHRLGTDPSMYVQNAGITDSTLAPAGMSTLYLLIPVTQRHPNVDWRREAAGYREVALDQLERLGIHGIRERIRYEKMLTPDDWQDGYEIYRGATFNLSQADAAPSAAQSVRGSRWGLPRGGWYASRQRAARDLLLGPDRFRPAPERFGHRRPPLGPTAGERQHDSRHGTRPGGMTAARWPLLQHRLPSAQRLRQPRTAR